MRIIFGVILSFMTTAVFADGLPVKVQRDMFLMSLAEDLKAKQFAKSLRTIKKLRALGAQLPNITDFFEGKAHCELEQYEKCEQALTSYIKKTGSSGGQYKRSLKLLMKAREEIAEIKRQKRAEAERERQEKIKIERRRQVKIEMLEAFNRAMVYIPGGTFRMGCVSGKGCRSDEKPVHRVTVGSFYLSKYETTFAQWDACVADGGCNGYRPKDNGWGRGNRPVIYVSWKDANAYAKWLSRKTGHTWRLPTEAEWEYAARAGSRTKYSWGDSIGRNKANCKVCGSKWDNKKTAPVGSFSGNKFGVYDMHGNVWEWVHDWYGKNYYSNSTSNDPKGSKNGSLRVGRGGGWRSIAKVLRSANRGYSSPDVRNRHLGFRLLRQP